MGCIIDQWSAVALLLIMIVTRECCVDNCVIKRRIGLKLDVISNKVRWKLSPWTKIELGVSASKKLERPGSFSLSIDGSSSGRIVPNQIIKDRNRICSHVANIESQGGGLGSLDGDPVDHDYFNLALVSSNPGSDERRFTLLEMIICSDQCSHVIAGLLEDRNEEKKVQCESPLKQVKAKHYKQVYLNK